MGTEQFDAVIVGAGFGGIGAAIALRGLGYHNIAILEREADVGGTWYVNHYPGLEVDVPSTTYSYWFEPNPYWSRLFAPGAELKSYADHVVHKYDLRRHMRFNTTVSSARWDDDAQHWQVTLADGETLTTRYLITATGFLSQPNTPDIPGIAEFDGHIIHTTAWEDDYDLTGRRVAIIGTGATAVQLIPEVAKRCAQLTVYQRTPIHVVPKLNFSIAPPVQRLFARIPPLQRAVRWFTDTLYELMMVSAVLNYRYFRRLNIAASDLAKINRFIWIRDRQLRAALTPPYDFGCKRPTYSNTYYRAFTRPHVHLRTAGINRIEPDGIVAADGDKVEIDTLVLATGFDLWDANFPAIEVLGRGGRNLGKWWRDNGFQAYQGVSVPEFPNYLSLASPFAFSGLSFFNVMEYQMRHIRRLLGEVQRRTATTFEVTEDATAAFCDRMTHLLEDSVFYRGNCATSRSYYFNNAGEAILLRPTSTRNAVREGQNFALQDYRFS